MSRILITLLFLFLSQSVIAEKIRFAVIGDYGSNKPAEKQVADMIKNWKPNFIVTLGDNNYPDGEAETIDQNIGQYYHDFIYPYKGKYGKGADRNRFFPVMGNHDSRTDNGQPYLDYFDLPGNKRYYDFVLGSVHFFALNSCKEEPDGVDRDSKQALWLKQKLKDSKASFKVVMLHHPPYSSGHHTSNVNMQWPFKEWGASLVMSGHDHDYQRIEEGHMTYIVNGVGGQGLRDPFKHPPVPGTKVRFHDYHGAMLCEADDKNLRCEFINVQGKTMDDFSIAAR